jgi:hypothetical protein
VGTDRTAAAVELAIPGVEGLEQIGRGGFATVYRGWQAEFHRSVAVKVLDPADAPTADRFRREVKAMGALSDHPNVVPVYGAGSVDGRGYLVMPFLAGGSLEERMLRAAVTPAEVVRIGRAVAGALAAAHRAGLLHRDVKPANVLFTSYDEPKLADFGIARFTDTTATQGDILATIGFAAPEVLEGHTATAASDVYSLGATLHGALRGAPPFAAAHGEPPIATAMRVLHDPPADLLATGVPPALAAVIDRAMEKDPAARFPSADALLEALDRVDLSAPSPAHGLDTTQVVPVAPATVAITTPPTPVAWPAPSAAQPAAPDSARRAAARSRRPNAVWLAAVAGVSLVLVALIAVLLSQSGDGGAGSATATTAAPGAAATPTTARAATGSAKPTTTRSLGPTPTGSPAEATRAYYAAMGASTIDEGWARLSPAYQARVGRSSYEGFWRTIARVEVLEVAEQGSTALATLRYTRTDGSTSTERARLAFTPDPRSGACSEVRPLSPRPTAVGARRLLAWRAGPPHR